MTLAGQTVGIVAVTDTATRNRLNQPTQTRTVTYVHDVLMRPVSATEDTTLTELANEVWRCTAPAGTAAAISSDLLYDGTSSPADLPSNRFRITAVQPFVDFAGATSHVRITCERETS